MSKLPKLEPPNTTTSSFTTSPPRHRFISGLSVPLPVAANYKYIGNFGVWMANKSMVSFGYDLSIMMMGFRCDEYQFEDFCMDIENIVLNKVRVCGPHTIPAFKPISKKDKLNSKAVMIDRDNWAYVKVELCRNNIMVGVILLADAECNAFRRSCNIGKYVKEDKKRKSKTEEKKSGIIDHGLSSNPYATQRRSDFMVRAGLDVTDLGFIVDNKDLMSDTIKKIYLAHPFMKKSPKTTTRWTMNMIKNKSIDIKAIPTKFRKEAIKEARAKTRPARLMTVLQDNGIGATSTSTHNNQSEAPRIDKDEEGADNDEDCHFDFDNLENMKKKWMKEVEQDFKKKYMEKLMKDFNQ